MAQLIEELEDDGVYREYRYQRWLAKEGAAFRVVRMLADDGRTDELERICELTQPWLGPLHPRACTTHYVNFHEHELRIVIDDDRGPTFREAAAALADPIERERWSVAQLVGLCDAVTAMRARVPAVKLAIADTDLFVDIAGHVKLRAYAPHVENGRASTRAGGPPPRGVTAFLSPELCMAAPPSGASDVFVLASHLYTALSGRYAFDDENSLTTIMLVLQQPAAPLATQTRGLAGLIERAMAKAPEARPRDTAAFADELRHVVPDAADYDAVISDRIVAWRATKIAP